MKSWNNVDFFAFITIINSANKLSEKFYFNKTGNYFRFQLLESILLHWVTIEAEKEFSTSLHLLHQVSFYF